MIAPNELRIGNWVSPFISPRSNVDCFMISAEDILKLSQGVGEAYPIPLSSEILKRCGCYTLHGVIWRHRGLPESIDINDEKTHYELFINDEAGYKIAEIKYLHQLQNLYFALTGTELTINL